MTNKQKTELVYQMIAQLKQMRDGKHTSTAKLLGQATLSDEDFVFDQDDLQELHRELMRRAAKERMMLVSAGGGYGLDYLEEFTVQK